MKLHNLWNLLHSAFHQCSVFFTRALFRCSDARRSSHTHRTGPSHFFCCCSIHLELSTCWDSTVRKHSHFQTPLENPSIQTHLVLLCCIKRICILGSKGAIQIRYYYFYYYYSSFTGCQNHALKIKKNNNAHVMCKFCTHVWLILHSFSASFSATTWQWPLTIQSTTTQDNSINLVIDR